MPLTSKTFPEWRYLEPQGVEFYQAEAWQEFAALQHAFFTRRGGVSAPPHDRLNCSLRVNDLPEAAATNRERAARTLGLSPERVVYLNQVHGSRVLTITHGASLAGPEDALAYDAAITDRPQVGLCILSADCSPILLCDPNRPAIGAVHAGWRGTAAGVVQRAVEAMQEAFGTSPARLYALIGPTIGPCCYVVDEKVRQEFGNAPAAAVMPLPEDPRRFRLDLRLINAAQLEAQGVAPDRILSFPGCTSCLPDLFFSHRRTQGQTGRQVNMIYIIR